MFDETIFYRRYTQPRRLDPELLASAMASAEKVLGRTTPISERAKFVAIAYDVFVAVSEKRSQTAAIDHSRRPSAPRPTRAPCGVL